MQIPNGLVYSIFLWTVCVKWADSNISIHTEEEANVNKDNEGKLGVTPTIDVRTESDNSTLPPFVGWEMAVPNCHAHESELRCFSRGVLAVTIRGFILLVVVAILLTCVIAVNQKGNSASEARQLTKVNEISDRGCLIRTQDYIEQC